MSTAAGRTDAPAPGRLAPGRPGRKKLVIKPLKRAPALPEGFLDAAWTAFLLPAVHAIFGEEKVPVSLEVLYGKVEDVCMHGHAPELYERLRGVCEVEVGRQVGGLRGLVGGGEVFLAEVDDVWQRHCQRMIRIRAVFLKLDRGYVVQGGSGGVRGLWDMGLQQFRKDFGGTEGVEEKTVREVIGLVGKQRDGDAVDEMRMRSVLRMFAAIGVYDDAFHHRFVEATGEYYRKEAVRLMGAFDVPVYLLHVERRLSEEDERATQVLDALTRKPLISLIEQRLIGDHVAPILEKGFKQMCDERRKEDLNRCYTLFGRANQHVKVVSHNAHHRMRDYLVKYVKKVGLDLVMDKSKDSEMVPGLLNLKARLDDFVSTSFGGSDLFATATNSAFESFVNARENKPAELIAKYLDRILRQGNKQFSEEELESRLDKVLQLFRFIDGKDVFEAFYKKDLSKRLLHDKSASHDLEKVMISKLKAECGSQFTSKLEAMFRDVDASKDLMASFLRHAREDGRKVDLQVSVLEASRWPLSSQQQEVNLPQSLLDYQEAYKTFYLGKHNGRKLAWQHFDGSCVVKAEFPKGVKILALSLYQTVVVMLFNSTDSISFTDVKSASGIEVGELRRTLLSLACGNVRVLQKEPRGKTVEDGDVFVFNTNLTHKMTRIKVNAIQMKETVEENKGTTERVFQERGHQVDASIVRIMKTRKSLNHTELISEIFNQLRFPVKVADVKKRIESLLEREYIERSPDNSMMYNYLA